MEILKAFNMPSHDEFTEPCTVLLGFTEGQCKPFATFIESREGARTCSGRFSKYENADDDFARIYKRGY